MRADTKDTVNATGRVNPRRYFLSMTYLLASVIWAGPLMAGSADTAAGVGAGFSFDCDNTAAKPCRKLVARDGEKSVKIESSSATWAERYGKVIVVSDNFNDIAEQGAGHYVIGYFDPGDKGREIPVRPLLTPAQVEEFQLYDLEGVTLIGNRLYTIGSLALHGKNPERDRWERYQFLQMDLEEKAGRLQAVNLAHVAGQWPSFRDWLIDESGYQWSDEAIKGRAEAEGINVEALSATSKGTLIIGFRGPQAVDGGTLALEIKLPPSAKEAPKLVREYILPPADFSHIPKGAAKTLRAISMMPGKPGQYYVLLGPKGYEKDQLVLALWNSKTGKLSKATLLPKNFVAEGVTAIPGGKVLVVDDLEELLLFGQEE